MSNQKRLNKAAVIQGSDWGTAAQAGAAGLGITPLNPGAPQLSIAASEVNEIQDAGETDLDQPLTNPTDFSLDFQYHYTGMENLLLAMLFGTAAAPTQQDATAAYLHQLTMKDTTSAIFGTYAVEKGTKIHVVPSFKVTKWQLTSANGMIKSTFTLRGNQVTDADAVVTSLASVTYPDTHQRAKLSQAVFWMNAQDGDALDSGDALLPVQFNLEVERKMDSKHGASSGTIIEPLEDGKYIVKLTMEFSRLDAVNELYFANWSAESEKKASITITGALIASTYYRYLKLQFPRLKIESMEIPDGEIIPAKITLRGLVADAAPTGMTGITRPIDATIMNTRTTAYLA